MMCVCVSKVEAGEKQYRANPDLLCCLRAASVVSARGVAQNTQLVKVHVADCNLPLECDMVAEPVFVCTYIGDPPSPVFSWLPCIETAA